MFGWNVGSPMDSQSEGKIVNDAIHGHIELSKELFRVIDTTQFQRLRDLKQLGVTYFVFPGASHNRFEHSLGVCYLAGQMMKKIKYSQRELHVTDRDIHLVQLAGLCHDLGHGPFSHAFEAWLRGVGRHDFHHEVQSLKMLEFLIDDNGLDYDTEEIKFVKDLITGKPSRKWDGRQWMFDIVSNQRNSVDVDKFDYLARDCYNLGMKSTYDFSRLMAFCRVIDNEICYNSKEVYNVYEMFHTRYSLFKQVYLHRVGKAIEYMVGDALLKADPVLKISERLDDPAEYMTLTDSILLEIERSRQPELAEARNIIKRLRKRDLYRMADEIIIPTKQFEQLPRVTENDIVACQDTADPTTRFTAQDIIIDMFLCNYAMKDRNPVDNVHFYSAKNPNVKSKFSIPKESVSLLIPETFSEHYIRVYCRESKHVNAARRAFRKYILQRGYGTPTTPPHEFTMDLNRFTSNEIPTPTKKLTFSSP